MEELNEKGIVSRGRTWVLEEDWLANGWKSTEWEPLLSPEDKQKTTLRLFYRG